MPTGKLVGRAVLVSALGIAMVPVLGANPAYACSCVGGTDQDHYDRADVVFEGTVEDADPSARSGRRVFVFRPAKAHKGTVTAPQALSSIAQSSACGLELRGTGPFLVFAHKEVDDRPAELTPSSCSGTRPIKAGEEPQFHLTNAGIVSNAQPSQLAAENDDSSEWAPIAGGAVALAAAAIVGTAWATRRRRT